MNSLAQLEERAKDFRDISPPPEGTVFHHRRELLWTIHNYLDKSRSDANARGEMYSYLHSQFEIRLNGYVEGSKTCPGFLYPTSASPTNNRPQIFLEVWNDFANAIKVAAERLWRDEFLNDETDADVKRRFHGARGKKDDVSNAEEEAGHFELLCQQSHVLMHLYLQTMFCRVRAMQNVRAGGTILRPNKRKDRIEGQLAKLIKGYAKDLASWERQIHHGTGLRFFGIQYGDIQWFRTLSKEFGPSSVHAEETGWLTFAADARTELRYQYLKARMHDNWRTGHPLTASIQWLVGTTTGFGARPLRFVVTALGVIGGYWLLFFANDFFNPGIPAVLSGHYFCPADGSINQPWYIAIPKLIIKYLYLAVTNLSSLGSDSTLAQFCNSSFARVILTSSAVVGYFLLAMLAALLFQIITERD